MRKVAASEFTDGAVDLPQRPAEPQREQQHRDQHQRQQQRGLEEQLASRPVGLALQRRNVRVDLLIAQAGDGGRQIAEGDESRGQCARLG